MPPETLNLYFMSGTGNTYQVALWMQRLAKDRGLDTHLLQIGSGVKPIPNTAGPGNLLAMLLPTHGFTAPWPALSLAFRLPRGRGTAAFVVATRGGTQFWGQRIPGLEGTAGYVIALILGIRGYRVRGVAGVDMPVNWTAVHSALAPEKVEAIVNHARTRTENFLTPLLEGRTRFLGFVPLLFGLFLLPVSFGYLVYGRFLLAKLFFASSRCDLCGLCVACCPHGGTVWRGSNERRRPYWTLKCESCMRCMSVCPRQAVQAGHSWALLLAATLSYLLTVIAAGLKAALEPLPVTASDGLLQVLQYPFYLAILFLGYLIFWAGLRFRAVNAAFTFTTLTTCFRRYHEPEVTLSDLKLPRDL